MTVLRPSPLPRRLAAGWSLLLLLGLGACGPETGPVTEPGPPARLTIAGGGQTGTVGRPLGDSIVVRVTDAEGRGVAGVRVEFTAPPEGGGFAPRDGLTDEQGEIESAWTLGTHPGPAEASAAIEGLPALAISATALVGPAFRLHFEVEPGQPTAGATLEPPVAVRIQDEFGNPIPDWTGDVHLRLNQGALAGTTVVPATAGLATFGDLRIDEPGTEYRLTAESEGLVATSSEPFTVVPAPPPTPDSVAVAPAAPRLLVGETAALTATVLDPQGRPIADAVPSWTSSDPSVATVDDAGVVTALAIGSATITAESDGHRGTAEVSVSHAEGTLFGVTYCTIGGVEDLMDVYVPAASHPRPLPVAVHVHGGGWVSGTRSSGDRFADLRQRLLERGYLVVSLDYRLAPGHKYPAQIQDVKCAIRHLRSRAARYGLDPDRIGAWGGSAGGQLVALLGTAGPAAGFDDVGDFQGTSSAVQAVVALSAITDFTHPEELRDDYHRAFQTWPDPDSPEMIEASPVTHVGPGDAAFFFIAGEEDTLVLPDQSVRMNQRLRDSGVASSLLRVQHADHDLDPAGEIPIDPDADAIARRMVDFFDQQLR
jgi:acetyl esterase/lipase